jgi:phospholipase C
MSAIERSYSYIYKRVVRAVNPLKKKVIKTECIVHKFINVQAIEILKNDGHDEIYSKLSKYIDEINEGAVWADQDFKSSNHFFNPSTKKGLYGNSNARTECHNYYKRALREYFNGNIKDSMFYLGAACHLIQDLTIPQHANVELLHNHRAYENWVIKMHNKQRNFKVEEGGIYLDSVDGYIYLNTRKALETYKRFSEIKNNHIRFYKTTSVVLVMAQKTTAGLLHNFFYDVRRISVLRAHKRMSAIKTYEKLLAIKEFRKKVGSKLTA